MAADVIDFPNKPETFSAFLVYLAEINFGSKVTACSAVLSIDGVCTPYFFGNADAQETAFHALLLQQSALEASKEKS